ncbi:hypothetical protein [Nocardiopsis rhodophaea]|uniref:hypothetical protein n=1 Tax=Nocardiopsis rhodophaea TaxID=280238 RepID=UPI0031DCF0A6
MNRDVYFDAFGAFLEMAADRHEAARRQVWQDLAPRLPEGARPVGWHATIVHAHPWTLAEDTTGWGQETAERAVEDALRARMAGHVCTTVVSLDVARALGFGTPSDHGSAVVAVVYEVPGQGAQMRKEE